MRKPYSIRLFQFDNTSGGIKVMYGLYGALLLKGEEVVANAVYNDKNFVGIYPEISHGNELMAEHVVRYILNKPGVMTSNGIPGPMIFDPNDMIFVFSRLFVPDVSDDRLLFLPIINTEVFYDKKLKREKSAVFVGKGEDKGFHPDNCIKLDRNIAQDQEKLALILNECQVMYSYDPVSAMTEIARLCGCRVVYLSDEYTKSDYERYEPGINGMAFGIDDYSELDTEAFTDHYKKLKEKFYNEQLPNFIKVTQEK